MSKSGLPARPQSQPQAAPAGQSQYGERDLFGRQNQGAPSFSTPAKHAGSSPGHVASTTGEEPHAGAAESKPWILVATLLFASIGLNVYLGMIVWDLYERYRSTVDQLKTATEAHVA